MFKAGDKVRCIDPDIIRLFLEPNTIYTVLKNTRKRKYGNPIVHIQETTNHNVNKFDSTSFLKVEKRTWVYCQPPTTYEIAPCKCGNTEVEWSEYKDHLWCSVCKIDFIPEHWGVFDGPIQVNVCAMLGITFTRYNLETDEYED